VGVQRALRKLFSGYVAWTEKVKGLQRVPGLFGRYLQPPPTPNQGRHEREAINGPSQGGAVDMLKLQTNKLDIELGGGYSSRETRHMIHDSAIVTCPEDEAGEEFENFVKETMEGAVSLSVPIRVEVKRWGAS
jgi:DNA polymerase I-like protein with 3'-5' exonuclease and polymerase domains